MYTRKQHIPLAIWSIDFQPIVIAPFDIIFDVWEKVKYEQQTLDSQDENVRLQAVYLLSLGQLTFSLLPFLLSFETKNV